MHAQHLQLEQQEHRREDCQQSVIENLSAGGLRSEEMRERIRREHSSDSQNEQENLSERLRIELEIESEETNI
jgi:hypothetical protein